MSGSSDSLTPGSTFGSYRIVRELGRGGMGVVYEAESEDDGRIVALKLLLSGLDADDARKRFLREGRVAARLMHPNTVYVFGTQEIDGLPTIAMEYVAGGTLEDLVRERGPLPPADAMRMIGQVIDGLEAAHAGGILHRDVKPSNCFVAQDGTVKVGDFGLSRPTDGGEDMRVTQTGMILGTPAYSPPEQLLGEPLDVRSDIYSVGATLYFLLTGALPFPGTNPMAVLASVLQGTPAAPETHRPEIPKALSAIVLRAMARQPADRFASYADLRDALEALDESQVQPAKPVARIVAMFVDVMLVVLIEWSLINLFLPSGWDETHKTLDLLFIFTLFLLLRALPEWRWGAALGKRVVGLRVTDASGGPPSLISSVGRTVLIFVPNYADALIRAVVATSWQPVFYGSVIDLLAGLVLLSTMRRSNGYAGLHDRLFGTRVIRVRGRAAVKRFARGEAHATGIPASGERVGAFVVGADAFTLPDGSRVASATDATLGRPVWLHRVAEGVDARPVSRRNLARQARLRWVAGRRDAQERWDVYGAPGGQRLIDLPDAVAWETCRGWLDDLASELAAARIDGDPITFALADVWIAEGQQAMLLDFATASANAPTTGAGALLHAVARRALCGTASTTASEAANVSATAAVAWPPLPVSVRTFLDGLPRQTDASAIVATLVRLRETPTSITRVQRIRAAAITSVLPVVLAIAFAAAVVNEEYDRPPLQQKLAPMIREVTRSPQRAATPTDSNFSYRAGRRFARLIGARPDSAVRAARVARAAERRLLVAQYLATSQRAVLRDTVQRKKLVGDSLPWRALDSALVVLGAVSAADSARAWETVEQTWNGSLIEEDLSLTRAVGLSVGSLHAFMLLTGVCVCLVALFFRRGPVMRSMSLEVVTKSGQPASRLRLLVRSLATWMSVAPIPALILAVVSVNSETGSVPHRVFWFGVVGSGVSLLLGAVVFWYSLRRPERGFGDLVAGTVTVPE